MMTRKQYLWLALIAVVIVFFIGLTVLSVVLQLCMNAVLSTLNVIIWTALFVMRRRRYKREWLVNKLVDKIIAIRAILGEDGCKELRDALEKAESKSETREEKE